MSYLIKGELLEDVLENLPSTPDSNNTDLTLLEHPANYLGFPNKKFILYDEAFNETNSIGAKEIYFNNGYKTNGDQLYGIDKYTCPIPLSTTEGCFTTSRSFPYNWTSIYVKEDNKVYVKTASTESGLATATEQLLSDSRYLCLSLTGGCGGGGGSIVAQVYNDCLGGGSGGWGAHVVLFVQLINSNLGGVNEIRIEAPQTIPKGGAGQLSMSWQDNNQGNEFDTKAYDGEDGQSIKVNFYRGGYVQGTLEVEGGLGGGGAYHWNLSGDIYPGGGGRGGNYKFTVDGESYIYTAAHAPRALPKSGLDELCYVTYAFDGPEGNSGFSALNKGVVGYPGISVFERTEVIDYRVSYLHLYKQEKTSTSRIYDSRLTDWISNPDLGNGSVIEGGVDSPAQIALGGYIAPHISGDAIEPANVPSPEDSIGDGTAFGPGYGGTAYTTVGSKDVVTSGRHGSAPIVEVRYFAGNYNHMIQSGYYTWNKTLTDYEGSAEIIIPIQTTLRDSSSTLRGVACSAVYIKDDSEALAPALGYIVTNPPLLYQDVYVFASCPAAYWSQPDAREFYVVKDTEVPREFYKWFLENATRKYTAGGGGTGGSSGGNTGGGPSDPGFEEVPLT